MSQWNFSVLSRNNIQHAHIKFISSWTYYHLFMFNYYTQECSRDWILDTLIFFKCYTIPKSHELFVFVYGVELYTCGRTYVDVMTIQPLYCYVFLNHTSWPPPPIITLYLPGLLPQDVDICGVPRRGMSGKVFDLVQPPGPLCSPPRVGQNSGPGGV